MSEIGPTSTRSRRPWRMISWPAANGMQDSNPVPMAMTIPSRTCRDTASPSAITFCTWVTGPGQGWGGASHFTRSNDDRQARQWYRDVSDVDPNRLLSSVWSDPQNGQEGPTSACGPSSPARRGRPAGGTSRMTHPAPRLVPPGPGQRFREHPAAALGADGRREPGPVQQGSERPQESLAHRFPRLPQHAERDQRRERAARVGPEPAQRLRPGLPDDPFELRADLRSLRRQLQQPPPSVDRVEPLLLDQLAGALPERQVARLQGGVQDLRQRLIQHDVGDDQVRPARQRLLEQPDRARVLRGPRSEEHTSE